MKILEKGTKHLEKSRKTCRTCGTKLEITHEDVLKGYSGLDAELGYYINCPTCSEQIGLEETLPVVRQYINESRKSRLTDDR